MYSEPADGCNSVARMNGEPACFLTCKSLQAYFMNSNRFINLLIMHVHHGVMSCMQNRALHVHVRNYDVYAYTCSMSFIRFYNVSFLNCSPVVNVRMQYYTYSVYTCVFV